ncbi:outer membrane beta-barrel protein [Sulfurimonas sp.]|uniref:outer membrane beta-barrel protein n=1 Tax=Sulfurimonas sp. TaxID=2022749 RepID=UPI002B478D43|nr:outer membrane beta-barrel protein [Sulfurimonas sp.]
MKIILIILIFCTALLADRDGGPYVGVGYGLSSYSDDGIYKEITDADSTALLVYAGAYVNKHLSVELGYVNFNQGGDYKVVNDSDLKETISFSAMHVSTLAHYAFFDDTLDFYAKVGVGSMSASEGSSGFSVVYGAGVGYRFSKMWSMKIAYDKYNADYKKGTVDKAIDIGVLYSAIELQF